MRTAICKEILPQLLATSGVLILIMQTGIVDGWTSPNIARFTQANATIPLTPSEASWLASSFTLGKFVSVILVPVFLESMGGRSATLCAFIPVSVCWLMIMTTSSAMLLYIARFLSGITYVLAYNCALIYLGEIATPAYRGTIISTACIGWNFGAIMSSATEIFLSAILSCTIYLVPCIIGMLLFAWLPDSPYQLAKNKDLIRVRESLDWYRGHKQTEAEMKEIIEYVELAKKVTFTDKMKQLKSPVIKKTVVLVALIRLLPTLCGVYNVNFYMEVILTKSKSNLVDPGHMVVYVNVISLVVTIITVNLIDKWGRRTLTLVSTCVMTLSLLGLSLHYHLLNNVKIDPSEIQILPIVSVLMLTTFFTGYTTVMVTLLGEMFPSSIKSIAVTIVGFVAALTAFVSTMAYQFFIDSIGETYLFSSYAVLMTFSIPIFVFFLPETKGKSLQQIQLDLLKKRIISK